jgi:hypothetical protein
MNSAMFDVGRVYRRKQLHDELGGLGSAQVSGVLEGW